MGPFLDALEIGSPTSGKIEALQSTPRRHLRLVRRDDCTWHAVKTACRAERRPRVSGGTPSFLAAWLHGKQLAAANRISLTPVSRQMPQEICGCSPKATEADIAHLSGRHG